MTDEQVEEINRIIKKCNYRRMNAVCALETLPCEKVIDLGKCPEIIDYILKEEHKNDKCSKSKNHSR
jgi:hypothetical protein